MIRFASAKHQWGGSTLRGIGITAMICFAMAIGGLLLGCGGKATGADGTVIAEFDWNGKHQITLEEMQQEIGELPEYKQRQYKDSEGLTEYMTLMAESRLILCLAKDRKLDEDSEILKKVQGYLHELMVEEITAQEVEQKLKLTEEDFRLYYEANKSEYIDPEQVRLICIAIASEERANEVLERIKSGEDITAIAKELSDRRELTGPGANPESPGDTGFFSRNTYARTAPAFVEKAFAMEIGETTDAPLEILVQDTPYYMVFRKEDYKPERQKEFSEADVRKSVERAAEREKRDALMNNWLAQLRDRAKVKTFTDRIPDAPKEAPEPEADADEDADAVEEQ